MSDAARGQAIRLAAQQVQAGRFAEAEAICRRLLAADPADAAAHVQLAYCLVARNQAQEALEHFQSAATLLPQSAETQYNLGKILREVGRNAEAADAFSRAIALNPNLGPAYNNLANTLRDLGRLEEAERYYLQSLRLRPNHATSWYNLGLLRQDQMKLAEAMNCFERAIALSPDYHETRSAKAMLQLLLGDFAAGWAGYESRWHVPGAVKAREFGRPRWDGSDPGGRRILVHSEQGFGDTIQFCRYATLLAQRGANVTLECQPELKALLQSLEGVRQVIAAGESPPDFDVHVTLLSLPLLFGTTLQNVPARVPYLRPPADRVERWRSRLANSDSKRKVGLAWSGKVGYRNDRGKSTTLAALADLARVPDVRFFSLQKGEPARQTASPPAGMDIHDFTDELNDFADTAALIENLDLVISVDAAVAHLAGAMRNPVWVMLPFSPDWRWLLEREDSPWYPSMRLFRQPALGDWKSVISRVAEKLAAFSQS